MPTHTIDALNICTLLKKVRVYIATSLQVSVYTAVWLKTEFMHKH